MIHLELEDNTMTLAPDLARWLEGPDMPGVTVELIDPESDELVGLDYLYAELDADPTLVESKNFLDAYEFEYLAAHDTKPLAGWYREARAAQRRAAARKLTNQLDNLRKYKRAHVQPFAPREAYDYSDLDLELEYDDPMVAPATIFHPMKGDGLLLDELLDDMLGFDEVVEPVIEPQFNEQGEELVTPERAIRAARQVITRHDRKHLANEICSFRYDEGWAKRNPAKYSRGRIGNDSPLLTHGGETWSIVVARAKPASWDRESQSWVFKADGKDQVFVFVRTHLGTVTNEKTKRTHWTWEYHRYQKMDTVERAFELQRLLTNAFRNESSLESDTWQFTPGEALPFDPFVLARIEGGRESSQELAE